MDKEMLKHIQDQTIKMLKATGSIEPVLFIEGPEENEGVILVNIGFSNDQEKYNIMLDIGRQFAHMQPMSVTLVAEAWTMRGMPPQGKRISDMPERQECIVVLHDRHAPNSYQMAWQIPFSKIGKDIVLGESREISTDDEKVDDNIRIGNTILLPFWLGVSSAYLQPKDIQAN
jgi:hypothetical protein